VEHAFGAWHPRGGLYALVEAMARRLEALGGELRLATPVRRVVRRDGAVAGVETADGLVAADVVLANADPRPLAEDERSLSGFALMLGLRGRTAGLAHHAITFPTDYDAEFDDVFRTRRPVREPTLYVSAPSATDPAESPADAESWFVLVNAPPIGDGADWAAHEEALIDRLGVRDRIVARARRTPGDLERETGAAGGAIYGRAAHGRLGTLRRPHNAVRGTRGLWLVGGTTHPGGGLPLVALSGRIVAEQIGPA
jgi:phytoene dehydrogenase-like protein